mmetsp:Transcript_3976/g.8044  ORF Transcript_3976/g.8044 Transcript_3976/m.8044 type:complete len:87 (+) Transcript_3976:101-361(+)
MKKGVSGKEKGVFRFSSAACRDGRRTKDNVLISRTKGRLWSLHEKADSRDSDGRGEFVLPFSSCSRRQRQQCLEELGHGASVPWQY